MNITPPAMTITSRLACRSCGRAVEREPGLWAWIVDRSSAGVLCLDCGRLDPIERAARAVERAKRDTAVPKVWTKELYQDYLKSAHWRQFKTMYAMKEVKKCRVCGVYPPAQIDLHHNCYDHLGDERDHEVLWLCHDCHSLFHGKLPY